MENFLAYLQYITNSIKKDSFRDIHLVIGNESCDLDSCISSLTLAYFLHVHGIPEISETSLIVPIQNVTREGFLLHTENCFLLKEAGIPLELLIYKDDLNFNDLLKDKNVSTSLVDHHVLTKHNEILYNTVIQIYDHRPLDLSINWDEKKTRLKILEVGSCCTIITNDIIQTDKEFIFKQLGYLLYCTIIFDTIALLPKNGRVKELDLQVAKNLEEKYDFNEDRKILYDKLWKVHNDVSHFTPNQILLRDLKIVCGIPIPGLPMLVINFLKLENAHTAVKQLAEDYKVDLLVLMGLEATNEVKRDLSLYFKNRTTLKDTLLDSLYHSKETKGYDFGFDEIKTEFDDMVYLKQNNTRLSRKQIIPIIKDTLKGITST